MMASQAAASNARRGVHEKLGTTVSDVNTRPRRAGLLMPYVMRYGDTSWTERQLFTRKGGSPGSGGL